MTICGTMDGCSGVVGAVSMDGLGEGGEGRGRVEGGGNFYHYNTCRVLAVM